VVAKFDIAFDILRTMVRAISAPSPSMRILMVCMGNICRSPMAEGVLRHWVRAKKLNVITDSAGTISNHVGEAPDPRAQAAMRAHGIDISDLRARQVTPSDFQRFDLLLAMDEDNLEYLRSIAPNSEETAKAKLIMDYAPDHSGRSVPDPYYGEQESFEEVYRMLVDACANLITDLQRRG